MISPKFVFAGASGGSTSFATLTGAPGDNTALAAALAAKLPLVGGTLTGALTVTPAAAQSTPGLTLNQTWNAAGTVGVGLLLNITDTASAAASTPLCVKVGATNVLEVSKTGDLSSGGAAYSIWYLGAATGNRSLSLRAGGGGNISFSGAASVQLTGGIPLWSRSAASYIGLPRNCSYQFSNADNDFTGTAGAIVCSGTGSPEGVKTAPVGSLYLRQDGGAGTSLYVKESGTGNTGWIAK